MLSSRLKSFLTVKKNQIKYPYNKGYCTICEAKTFFIEHDKWLRDYYHCINCGSIPRNRALVNALNKFYPGWEKLTIHESSPGGPLYYYFKRKAIGYTTSQYFEDVPRGSVKDGFLSEDICNLTFGDETFDVFITSDVFEHVMEPAKAFKEIGRVLKKGGIHIFTMPWYPSLETTVQRAAKSSEGIMYLKEPVYHGNPIDEKGSLVTYDWGRDFIDFIYQNSGLSTTIYLEKNRHLGLDAEFLEVFISKKIASKIAEV
jgi:SAM-dependent methyltransferase